MSLERLISIEEVLPLTLMLFLGEVPEDLSIPMLLVGDTVSKENCCELDVIVKLKVGGKLNLFTIFPIGTTMQDGGKRKRSDVTVIHDIMLHFYLSFKIIIIKKRNSKTKEKKREIEYNQVHHLQFRQLSSLLFLFS